MSMELTDQPAHPPVTPAPAPIWRRAWGVIQRMDQRFDRLPGASALAVLLVGGVILGVGAALRARSGVNPPSFWYDDIWPSVLARRSSLRHFFELHSPIPIGFIAFLKLSEGILGQSHLALQLPAVIFYGLSALMTAALVARATGRVSVGLLAGVAIASHREFAFWAIRPKQFTLDVLVTGILLALALAFFEKPTLRRYCVLAGVALGALFFSVPSVFIGPLLLHCAALVLVLPGRPAWVRRGRVLAVAAAFDAVVLALFLLLWRQQSTPALESYWEAGFMPRDAAGAFKFMTTGPIVNFIIDALCRIPWTPLLLIPGLISALRSRLWPLVLFVLILVIELFTLSYLRIFPLSGGRLGAFLAPVVLLLCGLGVAALVVRLPLLPLLGTLALMGFVCRECWTEPVSYVGAGEKQAVERAEELLKPGDLLVCEPGGALAAALYARWPASLHHVTTTLTQFDVTLTIPGAAAVIVPDFWRHSLQAGAGALPASVRRVVVLGSQAPGSMYDSATGFFNEGGFATVENRKVNASFLGVYER